MFCKNCGAQIQDNQPFCPVCGAQNVAAQQQQQYGQQQYDPQQQQQYAQQPYAQQPYQQPYQQRPLRKQSSLDLKKLFILVAAGVFLLCCFLSLFKLLAVTTRYDSTTSVTTVRIGVESSFDFIIINLSGILMLAMCFFNLVKSKVLPLLISIGASLSAAFFLLLCLVNAADQNSSSGSSSVTAGLSVVGWLILLLELGAGALCVMSLLFTAKDAAKKKQ